MLIAGPIINNNMLNALKYISYLALFSKKMYWKIKHASYQLNYLKKSKIIKSNGEWNL